MSAQDTVDNEPSKTETTYQVTVTKIVRNFPFRNREYKDLGSVDEKGEKEYGYVYFDDAKKVETAVYNQEVDTVNLPAVIKAVNGMEG